jgi:von Willebrand factor type A domain.
VLLLDESETINNDNWKIVKTFSKKIVEAVGVSQTGNRAGVASFAKAARIRINCDEHLTTKSLVDAIDSLDRKSKL